MNSITRTFCQRLPAVHVAEFLGAVAVSSFRAPLLGLAVHADGMGETAQPGSCHAVLWIAGNSRAWGQLRYLSPALSSSAARC